MENLIRSSQQDQKTAQPNSNPKQTNQIYQSQQVQQNQINSLKTNDNKQQPQSSKQQITEQGFLALQKTAHKCFQDLKKTQDQLKNCQKELEEKNKQMQVLQRCKEVYDMAKKVVQRKNEQNQKNKDDHDDDDDLQGYDLRIDYKNMKQFITKGAEIKISKELQKEGKYLSKITDNCTSVGFLGKKNTGKSFLNELLIDRKIDQGYLHATEGINITFDKNKICYLDSAGLGETLQNFDGISDMVKKYNDFSKKNENDQKTKIYQQIRDKKNDILQNQNNLYLERLGTEKFSQLFMTKVCDIIIYVADILCLEEQKTITSIIRQIQEYGQDQQLIVIHNFKGIYLKEDIEQCIEKDIKSNFCLEDRVDNNDMNSPDFNMNYFKNYGHYQNKQKQNGQQISKTVHLVMAQQGSEIGDFYNAKSKDYIMNIIQNYNKEKSQKDIFLEFQKFLNEYLSQFIQLEKLQLKQDKHQNDNDNQSQSSSQQNSDSFQIQSLSQDCENKFELLNKKKIETKPDFKLIVDKNLICCEKYSNIEEKSIKYKDITVDFLGQPIDMRNSNDISPEYKVYYNKNENLKVIVLQIPGIQFIEKIKVNQESTQQSKVIRVRGAQSQSKIDNFYKETLRFESLDDFERNEKYEIKYGKFDIRIPIGSISENIDVTKLKPDYQYVKDFGLLIIPVQFLVEQNGSDSDF
ncbi:P-loop containing nucleoside triphosphate hydrolase [Pseudocohnilembus persalinus]|uniref:p-loop containing nucleoside triphosphate hydrolase n=1 Tax=Pseudocohnilembus persalinus TaxID=266149 RepID=A0A0V0R579_PSEPJ|nr:P-loop containing nucleoside triphosphate hydrolase [Pseudocohnilembus persalinus]|eukprot:KRX09650.1 P-loop containing nucleoside triphosphate hydrolase [Pseudocohnilembus persalinus]